MFRRLSDLPLGTVFELNFIKLRKVTNQTTDTHVDCPYLSGNHSARISLNTIVFELKTVNNI